MKKKREKQLKEMAELIQTDTFEFLMLTTKDKTYYVDGGLKKEPVYIGLKS